MSDKRIVPISEAATEVGLTQRTIYRYIQLGLLERYRSKTDRRTFVDVNALIELKEHPPFHHSE
jgi:DNA-binding transcriptional MerR regulator